jgi:hypothetical protein
MRKTNWVEKIKENVLTAVCTALVGIVVAGGAMLLRHDKKIDLLNYKVNIIVRHVAPEVHLPDDRDDSAIGDVLSPQPKDVAKH